MSKTIESRAEGNLDKGRGLVPSALAVIFAFSLYIIPAAPANAAIYYYQNGPVSNGAVVATPTGNTFGGEVHSHLVYSYGAFGESYFRSRTGGGSILGTGGYSAYGGDLKHPRHPDATSRCWWNANGLYSGSPAPNIICGRYF